MLSPNALKVLDALGVYQRVRVKEYNFETLELKHGSGKLIETYEFRGKEKYGYNGLQTYRHVLIDELVAMLKEKCLHVVFGKRYVKITSENDTGVSWEFQDRTT